MKKLTPEQFEWLCDELVQDYTDSIGCNEFIGEQIQKTLRLCTDFKADNSSYRK